MILAFSLGVSSGCYSYVPVSSTPASGSVVSLHINDVGRVALGRTIGPAVERIEGKVESATDSAYVLRMQSVTHFNGQQASWTGERVVVEREFVTNSATRIFSRSKTAGAIAGGAAALVAFIATRALLGSGNEPGDPDNGGGPPTDAFRLPWK